MDKKSRFGINSEKFWVFSFALAIPLILFPKVYKSYNDQYPQIYFYCLSASVIGIIGIWNFFKYQIPQIKITIIDLLIILLALYHIFYQLLYAQYFDLLIIARMLAGITIFISVRILKKTKWGIDIFFDILIASGIIEVLVILVEVIKIHSFYPNSIHSINGTFGNPNVVGIFLALLVPIAIFKYQKLQNGKFIYLIFSLLFISTIVLTKCRSAIIYLIFSSAVYLFLNFAQTNFRKLILISFVITLLLITLLNIWGKKKDSNTSRRLIWKITWEMIKEKPLTGYGLANFEKEYNLYQSQYLKNKSTSVNELYETGYVRQPYNEFFYFWVTDGITNFLIYLSVGILAAFYLLKSVIDQNNQILFTSSVSLVALFLVSVFTYTFYVPEIEMFLFLHLGIIASQIKSVKITTINVKVLIVPVICGTLFIGIYACTLIKADYQVSKTIESKLPNLQVNVFEKYYYLNSTNPQFLFNYALALIKARRYGEAIHQLEIVKSYSSYYEIYYVAGISNELVQRYDIAEQNYQTASALYPSMFRPNYSLFKLYLKENKLEKAIEIAQKIDQMPVKVNTSVTQKIKCEIESFLSHKVYSK